MDVRLALEKLSQQASLLRIEVLNGRIKRNPISQRPLTKDTADIYQGILLPEGTKVAVKTIHAGPPSSQEAIEVCISVVPAARTHRFVACCTGNTHLVKTPPRKHSTSTRDNHRFQPHCFIDLPFEKERDCNSLCAGLFHRSTTFGKLGVPCDGWGATYT